MTPGGIFVVTLYLASPGIEALTSADTCFISAVCTWNGIFPGKLSQIFIFPVRRNDDHIVIINLNIHKNHHQTKDK